MNRSFVSRLDRPSTSIHDRSARGGISARLRAVRRPSAGTGMHRDCGMATAEYAIATLAACGFAALLLTLLRSTEVRDLLFGIVQRALSIA